MWRDGRNQECTWAFYLLTPGVNRTAEYNSKSCVQTLFEEITTEKYYKCMSVILKTFFILSLSLALWAFCVVSVREHEWPRQYGGRQVL